MTGRQDIPVNAPRPIRVSNNRSAAGWSGDWSLSECEAAYRRFPRSMSAGPINQHSRPAIEWPPARAQPPPECQRGIGQMSPRGPHTVDSFDPQRNHLVRRGRGLAVGDLKVEVIVPTSVFRTRRENAGQHSDQPRRSRQAVSTANAIENRTGLALNAFADAALLLIKPVINSNVGVLMVSLFRKENGATGSQGSEWRYGAAHTT